MRLNREIRIVFQPKDPSLHDGKRRFGVGVHSLSKYVGEENAEMALERAEKSDADKCTVKLRKHGRVDFYFK